MKLFTRQFTPYFITQALGALNDNLFKNALVLLLTYQTAAFDTNLDAGTIASLAAGLFILPFGLFSGAGGHLADHYDKATLIRIFKCFELVIMVIAALGFWLSSFSVLMLCVFLMGAQSAFFGPVKYSILPASLKQSVLMKANGWVEMATFMMILLGTILAGVLASSGSAASIVASILGLSALGLWASLKVPACPPLSTAHWQWSVLWKSNVTAFRAAREVKSVWLSVLGISWFWFIGALVLAQLPDLAKNYL
ncbi:MAG: MFS transporter, partial [Limnobacter sp.]|nr:MFS transporter [Limnobacter sp.]